MNTDLPTDIHRVIGVDADGNVFYVSNIIDQPFIQANAARRPLFLDLHANYDNIA